MREGVAMGGVVGKTVEQAVERVIVAMRDGLGDELTVDDMARVAMFSKFYFTRIFARVTGVSPGRFLAALRLEQAKRLLVSTSLNVADICMRVGYNSVGTFSSRFAKSVGLSPTAYRRLCGFSREIHVQPAQPGVAGSDASGADVATSGNAGDASFDASGDPGGGAGGGAVVAGRILSRPSTHPGRVFVGLFPGRIAEGRPARCVVLDEPGPYRLERVPPGTWYVLSLCRTTDPVARGGADLPPADSAGVVESPVLVAAHGPVEVGVDTVVATADLRLAPMRVLDPPVLLALEPRQMS